ncbi:hypothetical protein [Shewanella waksmanii]|uniref:hypothetical protein n=1 Tax=Shewanella waksmanii TaxID=213783 RepID=UPI0004AC7410|nr:hypothetical protein [Shewanella waksmanii]
MRKLILMIAALTLVGCASAPDDENLCGTVSGYLEPAKDQGLYRAVVTHLDGKPVISKPNYQLAPGEYQFTVAELISDPAVKVKLAARTPKQFVINVEANERYHIGAQFNAGKIYRGMDDSYWQPVVWQQESYDCERVKLPASNQ